MAPNRLQLKKLKAFLSAFEEPGRAYGEWHDPEPQAPGHFEIPWVTYPPDLQQFIKFIYDSGLLDVNYNKEEIDDRYLDPAYIDSTAYPETRQVLTYAMRRDYYSAGSLKQDLESGHLQHILRHLLQQAGQQSIWQPTILLGAIAGDVIGSIYEKDAPTNKNYPLFGHANRLTDDSILTLAVAKAVLEGGSYHEQILAFGRRYPHAGYGGAFRNWLCAANPHPYNSFGNGSAMRASPVGWAFESEEEVLRQAKASADVTHNHPEGVKGAQAVALAIFMARKTADKQTIQREIEARFGYDLSRRLDLIRPTYQWDVTCQGSVPESIIAFLESEDVESAIRNAISLEGDADTMAAIAGSIAEAYYDGLPVDMTNQVLRRIPPELRAVLDQFNQLYG